MLSDDLLAEANRQFSLCNACRYCEGLCSVFPAMEKRSDFTLGDVEYLSNLCHDCGACLHACPFGPPHEFAIDIPSLMTQARVETFESYARPRIAWRILSRPGPLAALMALSVVLFLVVPLASSDPGRFVQSHHGPGAFYQLIAYAWLLTLGFVLGGLALLAMLAGLKGFLVHTGGARGYLDPRAHAGALAAALRLTNLHGGGGGCSPHIGDSGKMRRHLHHLVAYGFAGMVIATTAAAIEQEFGGREPPYPVLSVPVMFGLIGGLATIVGCIGFAFLRTTKTHVAPEKASSESLSRLFGMSLLLTTFSGILVFAVRSTSALGIVLLIHLALVSVLFISLPYSKFVHWIYRYAALVKSEVESRESQRA